MQGSGIGGNSQGRKSADLIKVATRERWRGGDGRRSAVECVGEGMRLLAAGHCGQVSITSGLHFDAHPVGGAAMFEDKHGRQRRKLAVHQCVVYGKICAIQTQVHVRHDSWLLKDRAPVLVLTVCPALLLLWRGAALD